MATAEQPPEVGGPGTVLLVSSNGGHLAQLIALNAWWSSRRRTWVTFDTPDATSQLGGEAVVAAHHPTTRHVGNLLRNVVLARRVLRQVRPDLVVSTGAAVALPFFVLARLRGIPTVYIEVYDRVDSTTMTGRLCLPFTSRFLVQSASQQRLYRGSVVLGRLV